jgi:hypothetical protein
MITKDGERLVRTKGTPQGGVISPLLANLFLHYAVDIWMLRTWPNVQFARYADDLVFHCGTMKEVANLLNSLRQRLDSVGLEVHPDKSGFVYLGAYERFNVKTKFTFLGYDFQYRTLRNENTGELFRKLTPGASQQGLRKITQTIKGWKVHRSTTDTLITFAQRHNATVRGWIEYYGKFWYRNFSYRLWSAMQSRLLKWVKAKFRMNNQEAESYLARFAGWGNFQSILLVTSSSTFI